MTKLIFYLTVIFTILMLLIPTAYKVINTNYTNLYHVTNSLIIEAAYKCYYADDCPDNKIELKTLYAKGYLEKDIINPVTKAIYSDKSYVILKKTDSIFNPL